MCKKQETTKSVQADMKINNMIFLEMKHNFLGVELWVNMSKQQIRQTHWIEDQCLEGRAEGMFKTVGQIGRGIHKSEQRAMGRKPGVAAHTWETEAAWVGRDHFKEKREEKRAGKG